MSDTSLYVASAPLAIPASGGIRRFQVQAKSVFILSATNKYALEFSTDGSQFGAFPPGLVINAADVNVIFIRNTDSVANTVVVGTCKAEIRDNRFAIDQGQTVPTNTKVQDVLVDGSGTITLGGTAQALFAARAARTYFLFQNNSGETLWLNFGATAVASQPSIAIQPNGSIVFEGNFIPTSAVSVIGATTGSAFTAKQG